MNNKLNITDLDLNFTKHPLTKDVSIKLGQDAIKQSLKNIILMNLLEKPFNIGLNLNLRDYLFENFDIFYMIQIKQEILKIITKYESRVIINNIDVNFDEKTQGLFVSIDYTIIGEEQNTQSLTINLERSR
jgi:hypothetical protein